MVALFVFVLQVDTAAGVMTVGCIVRGLIDCYLQRAYTLG